MFSVSIRFLIILVILFSFKVEAKTTSVCDEVADSYMADELLVSETQGRDTGSYPHRDTGSYPHKERFD